MLASFFSNKKRRRYSAYPGYLRRTKNGEIRQEKAVPTPLRRTYFTLLIFFFLCTTIWLAWFFSEPPFPYYRIRPRDTLQSLALKFDVTLQRIIDLNHIRPTDRLPPGKLILVPQNAYPGAIYVVRSNKETLSEISQLYNISQWDLAKYNDLDSPILEKGNILTLTQNRPNNYIVEPQDTLAGIAKKFQMSENQLVQYNALNSESVIPGQSLALYHNSTIDFRHLPVEVATKKPAPGNNLLAMVQKIQDWSKTLTPTVGQKKINTGEKNPTQIQSATNSPAGTKTGQATAVLTAKTLAKDYTYDLSAHNVQQDYQIATKLLKLFDQEVGSLETLGEELVGYAVMIDPGHGGHDPGAVVKTRVDGKEVYLVEDEFNYDISLRLYRLLKRHGAQVDMTILAPNNVIRESHDAADFANEKNEIYNDLSISFRPIGGRDGNVERIKIGEKFFRNVPQDKRIWISIHHDSSPDSPPGLVAIHLEAGPETYKLANQVIKIQKRGRIIEDKFFVLNENPAPAAVLLEVRNPAIGEEQQMLDPTIREQDALTICRAVISYVKQKELLPTPT